jgi:hypothetical protein
MRRSVSTGCLKANPLVDAGLKMIPHRVADALEETGLDIREVRRLLGGMTEAKRDEWVSNSYATRAAWEKEANKELATRLPVEIGKQLAGEGLSEETPSGCTQNLRAICDCRDAEFVTHWTLTKTNATLLREGIMKTSILALPVIIAFASVGSVANAQHVCKDAVTQVKGQVDADYNQWIKSLDGLPQPVKDAYTTVFNYNRDQAYLTADASGKMCDQKYALPQAVVDGVIAYYTVGLSRLLPQRVTHVDVSQIMSGKPLGGPNAAVPKFREQALAAVGGGGNGTVANVIRDPWKCATFQRKC